MGFTDAEELDILEDWFAGTARPNTPSHIGLFTVQPSDDGTGGTEVSGNAYARVAYAANGTNWGSGSAGDPAQIENLLEIAFPTASGGNWGTVVAAGYFDASSGGNLLFIFPLGTSKAVDDGDTAKIAAGTLLGKLGNPGDTFT